MYRSKKFENIPKCIESDCSGWKDKNDNENDNEQKTVANFVKDDDQKNHFQTTRADYVSKKRKRDESSVITPHNEKRNCYTSSRTDWMNTFS